MKKIILTGGGTAGHVTPNIAMLPRLREMGYEISYIGTYDGIEKKLIEDAGIPYYGISSGKLRRYFSLRNFSDPFRVMKGFRQAKKLMKKLQPDVVFSKGGFVSVPVVLAAERRKIPVVIHESDMTPGLANKIALPKAWDALMAERGKASEIAGRIGTVEHLRQYGKICSALGGAAYEERGFFHGLGAVQLCSELTYGDSAYFVHSFSR